MNHENSKILFIAIFFIGVILIAFFSLNDLIKTSSGEQYTELYILGSGHTTENYPFNITPFQNYSIYVGVVNHQSYSAYYNLVLRLLNHSDITKYKESGNQYYEEPLCKYHFILENGDNWEKNLVFSISNSTILGNQSQIDIIQINGQNFKFNKPSLWCYNSSMFDYRLLFELQIYDTDTNQFLNNYRLVNLQLNLTSIS